MESEDGPWAPEMAEKFQRQDIRLRLLDNISRQKKFDSFNKIVTRFPSATKVKVRIKCC